MKRKMMVAVFAGLLMGATGAWAQGDIIDDVVTGCEMEIANYCSQVTPGEGRLLACFYAHGDKLSAQCEYALYLGVGQLEEFANAVILVADACHDDLLAFCGDVELGQGRVATCLLESKAEVQDSCRQAMDEVGLELVEED